MSKQRSKDLRISVDSLQNPDVINTDPDFDIDTMYNEDMELSNELSQ